MGLFEAVKFLKNCHCSNRKLTKVISRFNTAEVCIYKCKMKIYVDRNKEMENMKQQ